MNIFHYPPLGANSISREIFSVLAADGTPVAVAKTESNGDEEITLFHPDAFGVIKRERLSMEHGPKPHQPHLARGKSDRCLVVWNACMNDEWQILFRSFESVASCGNERPPEIVHESAQAIFPPVVADDGSTTCVVWAEEVDGHFRVYFSCRVIGKSDWTAPKLLSTDEADCLRPCIVPVKDGWLAAWDRHIDDRYVIQYTVFDGRRESDVITLGHDRERWFRPRCVADPHGNAYMTWLAVSLVRDEALGIYDHQTAAVCARIEGDTAHILEDRDSRWDPRFVADLREGLLSTEVPNGHHGLRRNPQPCVWNDRLWLCWELRMETDNSQTQGFLVGRVWEKDAWSPTYLLHSDMLSYSLASNLNEDDVPVFFINFHQKGAHLARLDKLDLNNLSVFEQRDTQEWARWKPATHVVSHPRSESLNLQDENLRLFWADTHSHSVQSADAEGELDELVTVGRDVAGLDIMAIVDNDYYPYKALTEAEWQVLQAMAKHYTQPDRFVFFPAYEYTYHRPDVGPGDSDFNHRYIFYPVTGGPLVRRIDAGGASDAALMQTLRNTDANLIAHHCTWELLDPNLDRNVEVCSSWRICIEECDFIMRQLQAGKKFGFVGSSDSHRILPGLGGALTGVLATELTSAAVLDAYRRRRLIATSGCRMFIDFRVGGYFIGEEGQVTGKPSVTGKISAPRQIERVNVIRDGQVIHQLTPAADAVEIDFIDEDATVGHHFYFVRVKLVGDPSFNIGTENLSEYVPFRIKGRYPRNFARADGCFGWSSPIWIERF